MLIWQPACVSDRARSRVTSWMADASARGPRAGRPAYVRRERQQHLVWHESGAAPRTQSGSFSSAGLNMFLMIKHCDGMPGPVGAAGMPGTIPAIMPGIAPGIATRRGPPGATGTLLVPVDPPNAGLREAPMTDTC